MMFLLCTSKAEAEARAGASAIERRIRQEGGGNNPIATTLI
jgi:hypothetical protein